MLHTLNMPTRAASPSILTSKPVKHIRLSPPTASVSAIPKMSISSSASHLPKLLISLDPAHPNAKAPTRGSAQAAGYDLYASEEGTIPASGRAMIPTGIRLAIPLGCYGRVAPRSGLALKHGVDVGAGVIDSDYRGLLGILLFNFGKEDFTVKPGDRVAQLVLERIETPEVEVVQNLDDTVRGADGFGSTGGFGPTANAVAAAAASQNGNGAPTTS